MRRRKFVIGAGALFAGSAAAMGTGAFSAADTGPRQVSVTTTGDASGYVRLKKNEGSATSKYVTYEDGEIVFDADRFTEGGGASPNKNATFYYDNAFTIDIEDDMASAYKGRWVEGDFQVTVDDEELSGVHFYVGDTRDTEAGVVDERLGTKAGSGPDEVVVGFCVETSEVSGSGDIGSVTIELEGEGQGGDF
jgi:hypothetical protein